MATTTSEAKGNKNRKQRPVFSRSYFPVQVAVFEHDNDGRKNFSVKLTRSFRRSEEAEWEQTEYLSAQDLLPAAKLLGDAYSAIQALLEKAYRERRSDEPSYGGSDDPSF